MSARRVVRLLSRTKLTPRQRYRASPKGKAAQARWAAKKALDPAWRAGNVARVTAWRHDNPTRRRVYNRIWMRTARRVAKGASA